MIVGYEWKDRKGEEMQRTTPGGKENPPAEGLPLLESEGRTVEVELDGFTLPPFPLDIPLPLERTFGSG